MTDTDTDTNAAGDADAPSAPGRQAGTDEPTGPPVPPSGDQVVLSHGEQELVVVQAGGGIRTYRLGFWDIVDGYPYGAMADAGRGQVLAPWPNRVKDGRYPFGGTEQQLTLTEPANNNAIHGLVRWAPWGVQDQAEDRAVLTTRLLAQPGYPHVLDLSVEYALGPDGLTVIARATNSGDGAAPFGIGFHPYLSLGPGGVAGVSLTVPATTRLVPDDRLIPIGTAPLDGDEFDFRESRPVGDTVLDTCFTGLAREPDGIVRAVLADGTRRVTLWADDAFGYLQVFTGDTLHGDARRRSVAIEPMTCPADAFNSGAGLCSLEPGASWTGTWGIRPE